jgi:DNA-binding NarL/FixJ family response regulator
MVNMGHDAARTAGEDGQVDLSSLTAREVEIARLLTYGLTDAALAAHLGISVRTASKHVENLRLKLEMHSRWQVAEWAVAEGLRDL